MATQLDGKSTPLVTNLLAGQVSKVRVFIDRAAVTRSRTLSEPAREVVFSPVPLDADPATLRASAGVRGDDGAQKVPVRVTGVTWTVISSETPENRRAEVRRTIEQTDAKLRALDDEEHAESKNAQLVADYARIAAATLSREWLDRDPAFDKWGQAFDHLRKRHTELALARATRHAERQELERRKADLYAEELDLGHAEPLGHRVTVALELPSSAKGPLDVELTYLTKKAQWMPIYDARYHGRAGDVGDVGDVGERIVLTAVALVKQSTGEDWQGVELVATTARPPLSEPAPVLTPLHVTGHQGSAEREVVSTVRADARLQGAGARGPAAAEPGLTVEHRAPGVVDVPATGRPVRVELFTTELPCRARLEVAPRERPVAVLVADLENRSGRVLLPGKVNVFRGPNYSGQASLGFVTPHERFRLPLGTDASVRIKRELKAEPEKKGALTGAVTHAFESRILVENLGGAPIEVLVRDRVPVSRSEDATVKVTEHDRAMELHADTGLTTLAVALSPRAKREVVLGYKITAPRGFRISRPETSEFSKMSSKLRPALLVTAALTVTGCKRTPEVPVQGAPVAQLVARSEWPASEARGLSGLARDDRGRFFAVPERTRRLLVFTATGAPTLRSSTTAIEGVPEGTDLESLAWIDTSSAGERFLAGTESQLGDRETDVLYLGLLRGGVLSFAPAFELAYAPFAMRAEVNRGLEGLCVAGGVVVVAGETVGDDGKGRRFAPIAAIALPSALPTPGVPTALERAQPTLVRGPWRTARLFLTTDRGKLSALSCRPGPNETIEVLAVERHYERSRILSFTLPAAPPAPGTPTVDVTPDVWLDLAPPFGTEVPNFEGLERLGDSDVVLVADNDFGRALGPTIAVHARRPR